MARCLWFKVGTSPGPAFGRITVKQSSQRDSLRAGTWGLANALTAKPKEPCLGTGIQSTTVESVLASAGDSAGGHCTTNATPKKSSFPSTDGASQVRCLGEKQSVLTAAIFAFVVFKEGSQAG